MIAAPVATPVAIPSKEAAGRTSSGGPGPWLAGGAWAGLVAAAVVLGAGVRADPHAHVHAAPFVGTWSPLVGWRLLPAAALAAAVVVWAPGLARRLRWRALLVATAAASLAWAIALAWAEGRSLRAPLTTRYEYLAVVGRIRSAGSFLRGFVDAVPDYPTHVKSHPPGWPLLLWVLDRVGLGGPGPATVVVLATGALAGVAAVVVLRELVGDSAARRAAPFLAVAPAAVFTATSTDAAFAGLSAWGVALVVLATGRRGRRAMALAAVGGLLLAATVLCSYGLALLLILPAAVCGTRRRADVAAVAGAVVVTTALVFAAAGFWWLDGLGAAHTAYQRGVASLRPFSYFALANLAAFAVVVGPAAAAGLARLRHRGAWLVVGAALAAVALADASGLSKGEVERIWLPFVPWVVAACCALPGRAARPWLAAQVTTGLVLQAGLRSPW